MSPVTGGRQWSARLAGSLRAMLGVMLLVYVLKSGGAWASVQALFATVWLVALLNVVPLVGAAVESGRLAVLCHARGMTLPFPTGFRIVAIGALFNLWVPGGTGGDVMKLYYLAARHPGRKVEIATVLFVDRAVAFFALLVLLLGLLVFQTELLTVPTVRAAAIGVVLCLVLLMGGATVVGSVRIKNSGASRALLARIPLGRYVARAAGAAHEFRGHKRALLTAALLSFSGHCLLAATLAVAGSVLLPATAPLVASTLALLGLVANVLPVTPGGLGIGEAASEGLFRSIGVTGGAGLVAAWRTGMLLIGAIGAGFYTFGVRTAHAGSDDQGR